MALSISLPMYAKNALVVIAHGAPMEAWNKPVMQLEKDLQSKLNSTGIYGIDYVRVALMEFSTPTVASVIKDCENLGIDTIFAVPLFIAPSTHSEEDIPNLLGLQYNPKVIQSLKDEKTELVKTNIKIVLGTTLCYSDVLKKIMLDRIKEMSKTPKEEGILLLAHGDFSQGGCGRTGIWEEMMSDICNYIKENTDIDYATFNFVAMGFEFQKDINFILKKMDKSKKRILVQGVYISSTMQQMARMAKLTAADNQGFDVVYSDKAIIPQGSEDICNWIVSQAEFWAKNK